ncbi:hypothetical protein [Streptomyces sp. PTD9-10]|uniref:hypothetical protein n=1 Tax=Streptomyces sp. PTD9-10 TaxID=3120151 RepID=UPI00300B7A55
MWSTALRRIGLFVAEPPDWTRRAPVPEEVAGPRPAGIRPRPVGPDSRATGVVAAGDGQAANSQYVEVTQDKEALAGYLRAKLHAAKHRGTLNADETTIATAVHRLVTDHQQDGAEPQQFLSARLAAHELLNNPDLLADPTPLIGRTHRELFALALERLHRTNTRYSPLLRALGLAQGRGLPDQDGIWTRTAEALTPGGAGDAGGSITDLVHDAAPYLALDQEHGQSVYRLAHRTFTEHFTAAPDTPAAHTAITTALIGHARRTLDTEGSGGSTAPRHEDVSPYIRHHLITHARLGHAAGALRALADHPNILDTPRPRRHHHHPPSNAVCPPSEIPPAIAGTVLLQPTPRKPTPTSRTTTRSAGAGGGADSAPLTSKAPRRPPNHTSTHPPHGPPGRRHRPPPTAPPPTQRPPHRQGDRGGGVRRTRRHPTPRHRQPRRDGEDMEPAQQESTHAIPGRPGLRTHGTSRAAHRRNRLGLPRDRHLVRTHRPTHDRRTVPR